MTAADVGVFGGSGFHEFLDDTESVELDTEWGRPSAPVTIGTIGDKRVAFLPRHGLRHEYPPHRINYRANVDAMRQLGVRALLSPFAAGSLRREIKPGDFVVVDQLVDRTWGRESTFYDSFAASGPQHTAFADPYDDGLRVHLVDVAREQDITVHEAGTVVVVNGPRFSTRAESASFRAAGWDVINMTQCPEAQLAREAGLQFASVALVTDYDTGLADEPDIEAVTQEQVFAVFEQNVGRVRGLLLAVIPRL
ncbi:MAG TPA: S-methyl-5'-thioadenosine phosphorylase [Jiangellaceae bacterium]